MPIQATCPRCQYHYRLPDLLGGEPVRCKICAGIFVPGAGANGAAAVVLPSVSSNGAPKAHGAVAVATPPPALAPAEPEVDLPRTRPLGSAMLLPLALIIGGLIITVALLALVAGVLLILFMLSERNRHDRYYGAPTQPGWNPQAAPVDPGEPGPGGAFDQDPIRVAPPGGVPQGPPQEVPPVGRPNDPPIPKASPKPGGAPGRAPGKKEPGAFLIHRSPLLVPA